mmetsp:Transcript_42891/g.87715  ORF Transcript_42891/g.87715 Transcript_42891/m.87715 type:complete len:779 (+) Transcript_42891:522-2858(+)
MIRTNSQNALFKELVLQVPISDAPVLPNREESSSILSTASTVNTSPEHEIQVWDALLEQKVSVTVSSSTSFEELKNQIQSAQGRAGLRIIPSHNQVITLAGKSTSDASLVLDVLQSRAPRSHAFGLVVEPLVSELFSFFLASVSNLNCCQSAPSTCHFSRTVSSSSAATDAKLSSSSSSSPLLSPDPHAQSRDDEEDSGFFGAMDVHEEEGGNESEGTREREEAVHSLSTAPSCSSSTQAKRTVSWLEFRESLPALQLSTTTAAHAAAHGTLELDLNPMTSPDPMQSPNPMRSPDVRMRSPDSMQSPDGVLSSNSTPLLLAAEASSMFGCSYEGASILTALYSARGGLRCEEEGHAVRAGELDVTLLRCVGEAGEAYWTQAHLVLRNPQQSLPLLQRLKLGACEKMVLEVQSGLRHGHTPEEMMGELVGGCCGGTYVMRNNAGQKAAVFKPMDEEPYAPHNPKGFSSGSMDGASAMRAGIPVGGGAFRECAAFLLDRGGFAQVPSTTMLRITHSSILATLEAEVQIKAGSLQRFCEHECTVEDVGTASFPPEQVHAIGVFDVRTFNMDRNSDNILFSARGGGGGGGGAGAREDDDDDDEEAAANACRGVTRAAAKASARLVPIDHGYILPSLLHLEEVVACWLHWPQAKLPFSPSTLEYIDALDADADVEMLRSALGLSEESLMTLFLGTSLIKLAAAAGLTLHQIGKLMLRSTPEAPSAVEEVVTGALQALSSPAGAFPCADADRERLKHELRERLTALVAAAAAPAAPAAVHACCT